MTIAERLRVTLEMIKIEHTLFALPFAFLGATLAAQTMPPQPASFWISRLLWIIVAMVGARSAAMTFNRIADRDIDAANPRTATRALAAGALDLRFAWAFTIVSAALFLLAASRLNRLTLALSPVALCSVFLYSYTKRFTFLSHVVLGWCLGLAPAGAWMAVRGDLRLVAVLLSLTVMLWTAGFDVLYACQDYEFDRRAGLHSIPQRFGVKKALWAARGMHALMFAALVWLFFEVPLEYVGCVGVLATGALLVYQHSIVKANDLSRLNAAFFTTNAFVSVILFVTIAIDVFLLG
ncbi:MAG TPA: UbiA-like polyprenyltransferase [Blastocatellia bacterium]|jgi:4-hydroxybenzoate polyprenyltransferase|nr:UbiA-like polyprenyltransferase [Blastocatellia bacterium]